MLARETTFDILGEYLETSVMVKLKSGKKLKGVLKSYDQHLNLILNETEEMNEERTRRLGMVLIRGDTVVVISPAK